MVGEAEKNFEQKSVTIKTLFKKQSADRLAWGKAVAKRIIEKNYCNSSDEEKERKHYLINYLINISLHLPLSLHIIYSRMLKLTSLQFNNLYPLV